MREPYIFSSPPGADGYLTLPDDEISHLIKALRFVPGDHFVAFDGKGNGWRAEIVSVAKKRVTARALEALPAENSAVSITVAVGVVKGPRMEWAVEKAAELGAAHFIPLKTRFAVVEPGEGRKRRWENIALAAAKQSRRLKLMEFSFPKAIADLHLQHYSRVWVFDLAEDAITAGEFSPAERLFQLDKGEGILLVIGPEGGFADEEREFFRTIGARFISLGSHPLRTETALTAALVITQARIART